MDRLDVNHLLKGGIITASAPCRIDMGGTLDISTFHYPLRRFRPGTVNLAIGLRTRIDISAFTPDRIKVSSRGFDPVVADADTAPFDHPLGLIFAVAAYFGVRGIHIRIDSASPPRSGLGGSSVAAVALVAALSRLGSRQNKTVLTRSRISLLAHAIESGVARVPCGYQDQLAAAYGGVNAWEWRTDFRLPYRRRVLVAKRNQRRFQDQLLLAYSGVPHVSSDINGKWIRQFLSGRCREEWKQMIGYTEQFAESLKTGDIPAAVAAMNAEVDIRRRLTPAVLDDMGERLVAAARTAGCGARFTGAGGGGCLWALGPAPSIRQLRSTWRDLLSRRTSAGLLDHSIDSQGVRVEFKASAKPAQ